MLAGGESCVVLSSCPTTLRRLQGDGSIVTDLRGTLEVDHNFNTNVAVAPGDGLSSLGSHHPIHHIPGACHENSHFRHGLLRHAGWSGIMEAAQISSASIFGGHFQTKAECVVLNAGTRPIATTVKILNDNGATAATSNCSGPLDSGEFCSVVATISFQNPLASINFMNSFSCVATAGSTVNLRGALVIYEDVFDVVFGISNLQPMRAAPLE